MPALKFGQDIKPNRKEIYQKVFKKGCEEMGITDLPATVHFAELDLSGYAEGVLLQIADGTYLLAVHSENNLWRTTFTLGHELIHLKQYLKKEIQYIKGEGLMWGGVVFPTSLSQTDNFEIHKNLPWEKEAYARQVVVHQKILSVLSFWEFVRVVIGGFFR